MSRPTSQEPADSTSGCTVPGCEPSACARPTSGDERCLLHGSPASPSVMTCVTGSVTHSLTSQGADASEDGTGRGTPIVSISSLAASPAKTGVLPDNEPGSPAPAPAFSSTGPNGSQSSLFDQPGSCLRTSRDSYPLVAGETLGPSWGRWPTSGMGWRGAFSTLATSECPSDAVECSLSDILVGNPDPRYALSARAAKGILRRADARGRQLPPALEDALRQLSANTPAPAATVTERSS